MIHDYMHAYAIQCSLTSCMLPWAMKYTLSTLCILVNEDFQPVSDGTMIVFTSCDFMQYLTFNIIDDGELENDENIVVTLTNVILTHIGNGSILDLSNEEKDRLVWSMAETRITIKDDDSMFMCLGN